MTALARKTEDDWISAILRRTESLRYSRSYRIFNKLVTSFDFDLEIGKGETMKYILALKDQPEAAQLALRVGIAVAKSDGNFDDDEKSAVREIARSLGFDPAEFGL